MPIYVYLSIGYVVGMGIGYGLRTKLIDFRCTTAQHVVGFLFYAMLGIGLAWLNFK